jgi:hypothetical protein
MKGLEADGFIPSYLSTQAGAEVRFNAVATPNPTRTEWGFVPYDEFDSDESHKIWHLYHGAKLIQSLHAFYFTGDRLNEMRVFSADEKRYWADWGGDREFIVKMFNEQRAARARPIALSAGLFNGGIHYKAFFRPDRRDWDARIDLTADELPAYVAEQRRSGRRLDWLSAHHDGDKLTFQAIAVEDADKTPWDFQMGLPAKEYEAQLATRGAAGTRPLAVAGYGDAADTRYAVVWLKDDGFAPLFNGHTLTGWTTQVGGPSNWVVKDGVITCTGPADYLYTTRADFDDFHLRAEVKVNAKGNSGVLFRAAMPVKVGTDYEAQIALSGDQQRTGSLYNLAEVTDNRVKDDDWFRYEVIAQGNRVRLLLDGKEVVNYLDERPNRPTKGRIVLQHLTPQTSVHFRKVEIKELKAGAPVGVPPTRRADDRAAAEYVLGLGGWVQTVGVPKDVKRVEDLPPGRIELATVYLRGNRRVTDDGLAACAGLTALVHLDLVDTPVTDAGVVHFKNCKKLITLDLVDSLVGDAGVAHFAGCDGLANLWLSGTRVTDTGLATFAGSKTLHRLALDRTAVTDAGLGHFKENAGLSYLDLAATAVTDDGLANFAACKALTEVRLTRSKVTGDGLAHLENCTALRRAWLGGTKVGDDGLKHLKGFADLEFLELDATGLTDAGLAHLNGLARLKEVWVRNPKVTAKGVVELAKALPECSIVWIGGTTGPAKK